MSYANQDQSAGDPGPVVFVLFGATGDLARRLVLPAFFRLAREGLLPRQWLLVGNGRGDVAHESFRAHVHDALTEFGPEPGQKEWNAFAERVFFAGGGFSTDSPGSLPGVLGEARRSLGGDPQLIHYLAVPPVAFAGLTTALDQHGLCQGARVVYEKPFGTSGEDFRELDRVVHSVLDEQQVYRIDHFLGKEATQDLHVLRFANGSSAAYWNREHVESVQIDVPETLGISNRAQFYDATGAVLDLLVTHLFQVAAEVAMEPPASLGPVDLQAAREQVISCFRPLDPAEVVLGQFDGYRDVPGVDPRSSRDTFVAARLWIDSPRWRGVPFYLRTGKQMAESRQRVSLILRDPPGPLAGRCPAPATCCRSPSPATARSTCPWWPRSPARDWTSAWPGRRSRWPACTAPTRCRPTSGSSTTSCSATARCSPARTGWPRSGTWPSRCCLGRPGSTPTRPARGDPLRHATS